jgi:hypothetical protein
MVCFLHLHLDLSHTRLSVLVNYLRVHVKPMFHLYSILKDRVEPPTSDEIEVAAGKQRLDGKAEAEYLDRLSKSSENIKKAFQDQQARAIVSECRPRPRFICDLLFCNRGHGTKRNSSKSSWNGSSRVTSLSKRSKGLSSLR